MDLFWKSQFLCSLINRGYVSQSNGFSSSYVQMWELDHKESWTQKNWCFWVVVLETFESSLDYKKIQPVILKEISPEYSLEEMMLKLKLQYFGHLIWRSDSLEKTLMLEKMEDKRRGQQRMRWLDGITDSIDEFEQGLWVGNGQGSLACYSPWDCKELDTTEWLNWTELRSTNAFELNWEVLMLLNWTEKY